MRSESQPRQQRGGAPIPDALTDAELVRRVLGGEPELFEILVHRHSQRVYRASRAILKSDDEAEDVVQETFLRAYRKLGQFEGRARFSTWLTRIAVYEARARLRRRAVPSRDPETDVDAPREPDTDSDVERRVLMHEMRNMIEAAIDALPDRYRTVFVMRGVEEMTTAETAACLDLTEEAVRTRLSRARALLRKRLYAAVAPTRREAFRFAGDRCLRMWRERIEPAIRSMGSSGAEARKPIE